MMPNASVNTPLPTDYSWQPDLALHQSLARKDPVRLLKVMTLFAAGGTEGQVLNLVRRLDRSLFDLQFVCLRKWGHYLEEIEQRNIPITEYRLTSFFTPQLLNLQWQFAQQLRRQRVEIVHSYNFYSNVFAIPAAKMAGVPVTIASIRDQGVYLSPLQKKVQKWACGFADKILVNAGSIRDWLLDEGYAPEKIDIIRNGIDLTRYPRRAAPSPIRAELGLPADAPLVMMLSRLNPQKGVDDFIKAAALIKLQMPNVRFLIIGERLQHRDGHFQQDTSYHRQLHDLALNLGVDDRLIFTGHRTDVPEILAEGAVSVLPSHSEGLSNTLLESMAAGLPVVATQVGGNAELVQDGINGFLIPPQSPATLAHVILRILQDKPLATRFSQAARARASEYFSMERMVQDTQALYAAQLQERQKHKPV